MKKRVCALLLTAVLCCLMAAPALAVTYGTVFGGWLRLRQTPSYEAATLASYPNGTVVIILGYTGGWARVQTPDVRTGYMDMRYLNFSTSPTVKPTATPTAAPARTWTKVNRTAYVTSQNGKGVRMRSAPEVKNQNVMGLYPVGRKVTEVRLSNDGWSYIKVDNKYGYMMSQFLTTYVPAPTATPYVPGPTAVPIPTPTPASAQIESIKINPYSPRVGDKIQVIATPSNAEYTCVWYNDENMLLSTALTYTVRPADVGHVIHVRIQGVGKSAGFAADGTTAAVKELAAP